MSEALAGTGPVDFAVPERVVIVPVDLYPSGGCVRPVAMAFVAGTEPKVTCGPAKYAPAPSTIIRTEPADQASSPALQNPAAASQPATPGALTSNPGNHHSPDSSAGQTLGPHPDPLAGRDSNCYAKLPDGDGDVCRRPPKSA